jgi:hypothetical protein
LVSSVALPQPLAFVDLGRGEHDMTGQPAQRRVDAGIEVLVRITTPPRLSTRWSRYFTSGFATPATRSASAGTRTSA